MYISNPVTLPPPFTNPFHTHLLLPTHTHKIYEKKVLTCEIYLQLGGIILSSVYSIKANIFKELSAHKQKD